MDVSQRLSKRLGSIQKWRKRYLELGLSGLEDQPRSGRPRRLAIEGTKNSQGHRADHPQGIDSLEPAPHAEYAQVSKHQVTAIWKAADLAPPDSLFQDQQRS